MPEEPLVPREIYEKSAHIIEKIQRALERTTEEDAREVINEALRLYMVAVERGKEGCDFGAYDRKTGTFTAYAIWPFLGWFTPISLIPQPTWMRNKKVIKKK